MSSRISDLPNAAALTGVEMFVAVQAAADVKFTAATFLDWLGASGGGAPVSINYHFSDTTTDSDPGDGNLRLNNATQLSATSIRVDDVDVNSVNVTALIALFDDSTNANKGYIHLNKTQDKTKWIVFAVLSISVLSGYANISVTEVAGSGANPFVNGEAITLSFSRTGDVGGPGDPGDPGVQFYFGTGVPAGGLGVDGDVYLRTANDDLYQKISGTWTVIGNLRGATGAAGDGIASYLWQSESPPQTGTHKRFYTDRAGTLQWCRAEVENGDGSATANFDVLYDGTTIYTSSPKPSVSAGQFVGAERIPDTISFLKGHYFQVVVVDTGGTQGPLRLTINFSYEGI
jgi:hypothetical protein